LRNKKITISIFSKVKSEKGSFLLKKSLVTVSEKMLPIAEEQVISHVKLQIGVELGVIVHKACTPGFFPYMNKETKLLALGQRL
jgi:hypothetical protein